MDEAPLVSVVLPVFDSVMTLPAAVDSILSQAGVDLELIVIDDGSTDGGEQYLLEVAEHDSRVRPILLSHQGLVPALNVGLEASRGAFIARMDADDVAVRDRLAKQVAYLAAHPSVVAVGGAARFLIRGRLSSTTSQLPLGGGDLDRMLELDSPLIHPTAVIRKEALDRVGGYRAVFRHAEDYDLWLRLAEIGDLANVPDVVLHYRLDEGQVTIRHFEMSLLTKIGARRCAQYRHSGRPDPAPSEGVIGREWLLDHGLSVEEIDGMLLDTFIDRIWWLAGVGMFEAAESLVSELRTIQLAPSLRKDHRFRWRWEAARVAWCSSRRTRAVYWMVAAFVESPERWISRVLGRIRMPGRTVPE